MKFPTASIVAAARLTVLSAFTPTNNLSRTTMASVSTDGVATSRADYSVLNNAVDEQYPGTAVARMHSARARARAAVLEGEWEDVRRKVLEAGGLRDLPTARPGAGYTGHSFNDFNHCDLTTMAGAVASNENQGQVEGIARGNQLGPGISVASLPELGPGGSWSTCLIGCNRDPPQDVAHLQFKSRIAFKLVWCPPDFDKFVLVDDDGELLNVGKPTGRLPPSSERSRNFAEVQGSKYATAAIDEGKK